MGTETSTMRRALQWMLAVTVCALWGPATRAQLAEMPPDGSLPGMLVADFANAHSFGMDFPAGQGQSVLLTVTFENGDGEKSVDFRWNTRVVDGGTVVTDQTSSSHSTSFLPTAVCRHSSSSDTVFVAGWRQRSREVVIEEWTLGPAAIGITYHPLTGQPLITFSPPQVTRDEVFRSDQLAAAESIAHHPVSGRLYLLEFGSQANLLEVDPAQAGAPPVEVADATGLPALADARALRLCSHTVVPYVLACLENPEWAGKASDSGTVFFDVAGLGSFDASAALSASWDDIDAALPPSLWIPVH